MEGYIKLHRKILDNGIFRKPKVSHLFNYCLLRANWSDKTICWNGQPLVVERGSFITGRKQIALETGLSEQNVRYALRTLHTFGMVKPSSEKSTSKFTYLTVCNYNDYQHLEDEANQQSNQQVTSNQPASNQQVTTDKNNNTNNTKETNKNTKEDFEMWWVYWRAKSRDNPGIKNQAEKHWKELNKKLSAEQIQLATDIYLKATGKYHKAAERFLNPAHGLVQQSLEDKPPAKPSIQSDRSVSIVPSFKNQRDIVRRILANKNKQEAQQYWEEISESWREDKVIQKMFSEKN
jgi:predicted transcriptional regulator